MKRYIRASFSNSMPNWLRKELDSRYSRLKNAFLSKRVKLDTAEFKDHQETGYERPIYLLQTDYGNKIYCPGFNDDEQADINGRYRKLGSIAKSKLPDMAIDVVWIDMTDSNNIAERKEKYQDPRYSYSKGDGRGSYAGQYQRKEYLGDGKYGDPTWSKAGTTPRNENRSRDKSGYRVPSPEEKIAEYYSKFPEKITNKVDALYDRIQEVKVELMNADFNAPSDPYSRDDFRQAYRDFSEVIYEYRQILSSLDENRQLKNNRSWQEDGYQANQFARRVRSIMNDLDQIEEMILQ